MRAESVEIGLSITAILLVTAASASSHDTVELSREGSDSHSTTIILATAFAALVL
jgi:hypothetical protein